MKRKITFWTVLGVIFIVVGVVTYFEGWNSGISTIPDSEILDRIKVNGTNVTEQDIQAWYSNEGIDIIIVSNGLEEDLFCFQFSKNRITGLNKSAGNFGPFDLPTEYMVLTQRYHYHYQVVRTDDGEISVEIVKIDDIGPDILSISYIIAGSAMLVYACYHKIKSRK